MSVLNRKHLESADLVQGGKMVQSYKIAVLGEGGVGKSGETGALGQPDRKELCLAVDELRTVNHLLSVSPC